MSSLTADKEHYGEGLHDSLGAYEGCGNLREEWRNDEDQETDIIRTCFSLSCGGDAAYGVPCRRG